nr:MAG TPA: hypothetical protein [Caudoviricetes sp.]
MIRLALFGDNTIIVGSVLYFINIEYFLFLVLFYN